MSFSEDVLLSKLMTVNETQESIVKISQWILFHKRYAEQSAHVWHKYLIQAPENKKLPLLYLANEIVQQSRAKKKDEFVKSFAQVFPDAIGQTYKYLPHSTQNKIRRLVDVLKQRSIFNDSVTAAIENQISGQKKATFANSALGSSSIPPQLTTISSLIKTEVDSSNSTEVALKKTLNEYTQLFDSDTLPAPPLYNTKLSQIIAQMNSTEASLSNLLTTRKGLVNELKRLLETNENLLKKSESQLKDIQEKKKHALETKEELSSLLVNDSNNNEELESNNTVGSPSAPDIEELTPPATESFTPPAPESLTPPAPQSFTPPPPSQHEQDSLPTQPQPSYNDFVDDSQAPSYSPLSSDEEDDDENVTQPVAKKQKVSEVPEVPALSGTDLEGLDPAVAAFLSKLAP